MYVFIYLLHLLTNPTQPHNSDWHKLRIKGGGTLQLTLPPSKQERKPHIFVQIYKYLNGDIIIFNQWVELKFWWNKKSINNVLKYVKRRWHSGCWKNFFSPTWRRPTNLCIYHLYFLFFIYFFLKCKPLSPKLSTVLYN